MLEVGIEAQDVLGDRIQWTRDIAILPHSELGGPGALFVFILSSVFPVVNCRGGVCIGNGLELGPVMAIILVEVDSKIDFFFYLFFR